MGVIMKEKIDNKYFKWSLAAFSVIGASILLYFFFLRFDNFLGIFVRVFRILKPLIYGIVIAFILTQIFNFFDKKLTKLFTEKFKDAEKAKKW